MQKSKIKNQKFCTLRFAFYTRGAMLLPTILMLGALVMMIGMAGLAVGVALNRGNASIRASNKALEAARAGIADAERRILRGSQWVSTCGSFDSVGNPPYSITVGSDATALVCVKKNDSQYTVIAQGSARGRERRLTAVIAVDPITGQVKRESLYETETQL